MYFNICYIFALVAAVHAAPHACSNREYVQARSHIEEGLQTRNAGLTVAKRNDGDIELQPLRKCKLEIISLSYFDRKAVDKSFVESLIVDAAHERHMFGGAHLEFSEWKYSSDQCPSEPIILNVKPVEGNCAGSLAVELARTDHYNNYIVYGNQEEPAILQKGKRRGQNLSNDLDTVILEVTDCESPIVIDTCFSFKLQPIYIL
ncbi:hypothetical protein F5050DRAFT_1711500 [Lentinula boryana]|uniref:Uncharacterized protein n=1 Tax=Lentinula boryana TaxID=40481 RepID=A0ABQ8QF37_9AGAR|nr:hypothetical protein F5050DRAFT_1711500 [Lentinula boryana]